MNAKTQKSVIMKLVKNLKKISSAVVVIVAKVKTANHRTHTNYPGEPLNNEINIFEMLFGNLKDYVKEIIERLKKRFIKPKLVQEVVYVHQFKDYNNI
tara:strand:+ start:3872 stop:4165 length:294 start_codon:yes stop_codon:yes gene_type:complete